MTITLDAPEAREALRQRHRRDVDDLDYRRALLRLAETGASQREIARLLGISQPAVQKMLARAANLPHPAPGLSGATAWEICQRHAAGFLTREQVTAELAAFPYAPTSRVEGVDDLLVDPPGAWSEVSDAVLAHLIDQSIYAEAFQRRARPSDVEPCLETEARSG